MKRQRAFKVCKTCVAALIVPIAIPFVLLQCFWIVSWGPFLRRRWVLLRERVKEEYQNLLWTAPRAMQRLKRVAKRSQHLFQPCETKVTEQISPLLKLPLELQLRIWQLVYQDTTIHFVSHGKVLRHFICSREPALQDERMLDDAQFVQCGCLGSAFVPRKYISLTTEGVKTDREIEPRGKRLARLPGLHLTCKAMYANTISSVPSLYAYVGMITTALHVKNFFLLGMGLEDIC